jgi:hypothetical protein
MLTHRNTAVPGAAAGRTLRALAAPVARHRETSSDGTGS